MPLAKGKDRKTLRANYEELRKAGHPHDQAVAIMLKTAGVPEKHLKKGKR